MRAPRARLTSQRRAVPSGCGILIECRIYPQADLALRSIDLALQCTTRIWGDLGLGRRDGSDKVCSRLQSRAWTHDPKTKGKKMVAELVVNQIARKHVFLDFEVRRLSRICCDAYGTHRRSPGKHQHMIHSVIWKARRPSTSVFEFGPAGGNETRSGYHRRRETHMHAKQMASSTNSMDSGRAQGTTMRRRDGLNMVASEVGEIYKRRATAIRQKPIERRLTEHLRVRNRL